MKGPCLHRTSADKQNSHMAINLIFNRIFFIVVLGLCLTTREKKNLINEGEDTSGFRIGLLAYYPFNGNADDASGNENNGRVSGAVW